MTSELVERAQRGDHEAFDALATAAYHRLYAVAARILRDGYAAEDAVQDTLVRAWRDIAGLRDRDRFEPWLHRLLVHACADQFRRRRRRRIEVVVESVDLPDPVDDLTRIADRDEISRAFQTLTVEQRAALVFTHYVGLSAPEIADWLGIPTGTVYSRIHHAKRVMRASLVANAPSAPMTTPEHGR